MWNRTLGWALLAVSLALGCTYFIDLSRAIILRGASLEEFRQHLFVLAAMGIGLLFCVRCASGRSRAELSGASMGVDS